MPIYKGRKPGTHRVVVWSGGRSREWIVEGTRKDALAFEAQKRLDLGSGQAPRVSPSFRVFCAETYEPHAVAHLRPSTWGNVRVYQVATLARHLGDLRIDAITSEHVEAFKRARRADGMKASSINNELRVLGTVLRFARSMGYPAAQPTIKKLPTAGEARVHVWTADQVFQKAR